MIPADWTPHRRDHGELLGWIRPDGDDWLAVDLLGRKASDAVDWLEAEAALERRGLAWLADPWMLERPHAGILRVRLVEVTPGREGEPGRVVVKADDGGAIGGPPTPRFTLPWPAPAALRAVRPSDPRLTPWS